MGKNDFAGLFYSRQPIAFPVYVVELDDRSVFECDSFGSMSRFELIDVQNGEYQALDREGKILVFSVDEKKRVHLGDTDLHVDREQFAQLRKSAQQI